MNPAYDAMRCFRTGSCIQITSSCKLHGDVDKIVSNGLGD